MKTTRTLVILLFTLGAALIDLKLALLFATTSAIAVVAMPMVIKMMNRLHILDYPNSRTSHESPVPTCGGLGIFLGLVPVLGHVIYFSQSMDMIAISIATIALMATGVIDDIKELAPKPKFLIQFLAAGLVVYAGVRLQSLHGLFGIYYIEPMWQYTISLIIIIGVTNATNLMDGIDGLAGGIGFIISLSLGILLYSVGEMSFAMLGFGLAGSLLGFLYYNFNPAKIFMGDTGSLIVGFIIICLGIRLSLHDAVSFQGVVLERPTLLIIGMFILPVYDTLRIFLERMMKGVSPFSPDTNHIHHLLIKTGFNHARSSQILYAGQIGLLFTSFLLSLTELPSTTVLLILFAQTMILSEILTLVKLLRTAVKARGVNRILRMKASKNALLINNIKV
ncbi:MAG: UDP-GlcNAc:undecaprenyl-phosphate GlcNAc-1-phosphate transferase [Granulosicoccus sp.]|jgi:UDP-GlcNAc:undecaprenyl-phosphate GlcNAc-1-phosphate transferase